jgi:hypothetical protein
VPEASEKPLRRSLHSKKFAAEGEKMVKNHDKKKRLELGRVVATPGALRALEEAGQMPDEFLALHRNGDWGIVCDEDKSLNDEALEQGLRILSAYRLRTGTKIWIISEWDRSVTTILRPQEY